MSTTKQKIASDLDRQFAEQGFAEQGVEALRAGADVSLRTLYKYFPSREAMVVGALEHRDKTYFDWLAGGPETGIDHVLYPIIRLGDWLNEVANTGCLFLNALAEHPESAAIREIVTDHKARLADEFRIRLQTIAPDRDIEQVAETLFLLHEGMTQTARLQGRNRATAAALRAVKAALAAEGIA
ncbi:TetR/AcrR family transcriptional regulator [Mesorhizobium sp.]|uniref:TetR/AcrR family transcriptional regulator n=2 Tax=unclassified Mesorhizobium TaxID=325217 RepID=UPI000FE8D568|nr:TetR/AcrR family transcriptional regulator [Mesorhizobium sp.]RWE37936.1 MAG: TetR/AcrR family transcriptional regulator [Mesorhizobium sp.]